MISALRKIEGRGELAGATSAVMEMCVDNPREGFADLFATHPSIEARVKALIQFAGGHDPGPLALPSDTSAERRRSSDAGRISRVDQTPPPIAAVPGAMPANRRRPRRECRRLRAAAAGSARSLGPARLSPTGGRHPRASNELREE